MTTQNSKKQNINIIVIAFGDKYYALCDAPFTGNHIIYTETLSLLP